MPSEDQLKSQMQAAIAKKKNDLVGAQHVVPVIEPESITPPKSVEKPEPPKIIKATHPAIYQPTTATASSNPEKVTDSDPAVSSDAELTRSFFGRPIRVAIYDKKVYFAVPDVLNVSNDPDKHDRYSQLHKSAEKKDFLEGIIQRMRFPSPNGGHDKLDAATAENMIKIIEKLELKFPEPIEKWLLSITENLTVLL